MKKNKLNKAAAIFTIIGAIATLAFGLIQLLANSETSEINNYSGNINQQNGDGTFNQYIIEGDMFTGDNYNISEKEPFIDYQSVLYQRLKDYTSEDILCFVSDDYDNDGRLEAFAFVGKHYEDKEFGDQWTGIPYFVNDQKVKKLSSNTRYGQYVDEDWYWAIYKEIELGKNKAIGFSLYYATGAADEIFGVKNGEPIKYEIPNYRGNINVTENFITLTISDYDYSCYESSNSREIWTGHTWKPYYFFWNDGTNNFCEYGGIEISLEQLNRIKDVSKIIEEYEHNGYSVLNILYRANGIVNINFEKIEQSCKTYLNVTLFIQNYDTTNLIDGEILDKNEGIYVSAINPEIAVYPNFSY